MNYIDIIILIPILWGAYRGFTKGFVVSIASFAALFLGIMIAIYFSDVLVTWMGASLGWEGSMVPLLAFAILFVAVIILIHLLARVVERLLKATAMNWLNKIAGLVFGAAKWLLIISVVLMMLQSIDQRISIIPQEETRESLLFPVVAGAVPKLLPYVRGSKLLNKEVKQETTQE